jgi:ubiquinone/menaquinone biosynthesis C-methylase UbiE
MGASGADWLDRHERESEEQPDKAIAELNLKPGMFVGDVGAGTGFYSLRIAKVVGPNGTVYANDIQPTMLDRLNTNASAQHVSNIVTILGTESDPKLPAGKLDLVILVDVYHEFSRPQRMLSRIRESLKPDGRLVLLEYRKEDPSVPIRPEHKMSVQEVKAEVTPEGYRFEKVVPGFASCVKVKIRRRGLFSHELDSSPPVVYRFGNCFRTFDGKVIFQERPYRSLTSRRYRKVALSRLRLEP